MSFASRFGRDLARGVSIAIVLALVVALFLWWLLVEGNQKRYSAVFTGVIGLYESNDVRVLGVKVGHVDKVTPNGDTVRVDMLVDRTVRIPATAKAVIVAPALVSDRYVQFTPVYTGGQVMAEGAVLGKDRTATPLEVDDLYASLNRVSVTLGPNGVNKDGALADLLNTLAKNADGNGAALNQTITQLSQMARTLSGSDEDLFATVDNLGQFTNMLARNDGAGVLRCAVEIGRFARDLAPDVVHTHDASTALWMYLRTERGKRPLVSTIHNVMSAHLGEELAPVAAMVKESAWVTGVSQAVVDDTAALFPEVTERLSHGEPTWFVRDKKVFVQSSDHHHDDHELDRHLRLGHVR